MVLVHVVPALMDLELDFLLTWFVDFYVCWQEDLTPERVVELVEELKQGKKPKVQ